MYETIDIPEKQETPTLFGISSVTMGRVTIFLPVLGFFFSIIWSLIFNFEKTTWTHCRVVNFLPSISAAFNYPPSSFVWRICIAFHAAPRFLLIAVYYQYNRRRRMKQTNSLSRYQGLLSRFAAFSNAVENFSLIILSNVSSGENKAIHVLGFTCFVLFSMSYMSTMCTMHSATSHDTHNQRIAWKMKKMSCLVYFVSLTVAIYFYKRHNKHCEPYVYTMFALCEYFVVLSNMTFHYAATYEFDDYSLKFQKQETSKVY